VSAKGSCMVEENSARPWTATILDSSYLSCTCLRLTSTKSSRVDWNNRAVLDLCIFVSSKTAVPTYPRSNFTLAIAVESKEQPKQCSFLADASR
jgi:hypothetical protein